MKHRQTIRRLFCAVLAVLLLAAGTPALAASTGTVQLPEGTYTGDLVNGVPNGNGTLTYSSSDSSGRKSYTGQWKDGKREGIGTLSWTNGAMYAGEWKAGQRSGTGTIVYSSGNSYQGQWQSDKYHGLGTYRWEDGTVVRGAFSQGKQEGWGVYTAASGNIYAGRWKNDKRNGVFYRMNASDKSLTRIEYTDGEGKTVSPATTTATLVDGSYKGSLSNQKPNGFGILTFKSTDSDGRAAFAGNWVGGSTSGYGALSYKDGSLFVGQWTASGPNGYGIIVTKDGDCGYGPWSGGKMDGAFSVVGASGETGTQTYKAGQLVGDGAGTGTGTTTPGGTLQSTAGKTVVAQPLAADPLVYTNSASTAYIQDPQKYFGSSLTFSKKSVDGQHTVWKFRRTGGKDKDLAALEAYVKAVCGAGNLKLADSHMDSSISFAFGPQTFFSWDIDYTGSGGVTAKTKSPYTTEKQCSVCVWGEVTSANTAYYIYIPSEMQMVDMGLRCSGGNVSTGMPAGTSGLTGLYKLSDGSFQTSDGRLTAKMGQATVLRDGKSYTTAATYKINGEKDELWVKDFYRNEAIYFSSPKSAVMTGDTFTLADLSRDTSYSLSSADSFGGYAMTPFLGIGRDGSFIMPSREEGNPFQKVLVRIMYWNPGVEAVYYVYAGFSGSPGAFEALCAVSLQVEPESTNSNSGGSTEILHRCSTCGGSKEVTCRNCDGRGYTSMWIMGKESTKSCAKCHMRGRVDCPDCNGTGQR